LSVARGPDVAKVRPLTDRCGLWVVVDAYNASKGPFQCKCCQCFGHTQRNCGYAPRCVVCGDAHPSRKCVTPHQRLKCCGCGGDHTANCRGSSKPKEAEVPGAKPGQGEVGWKDGVSTRQRPDQPQLIPLPNRRNWLEQRCPRWPRRQRSGYTQPYTHFIRHRKTDPVVGYPNGRSK
jgi:hypothetical protein